MSSVLVAGPDSIAPLLQDIAAAIEQTGFPATLTNAPILEQPPETLAQTSAVISILTPLGPAEFSAMPDLRAATSPIMGYDWIDVDAATARDILVANGEVTENYESMAEATIMLMLVSLYDLQSSERQLREMLPRPTGPMSARMVSGKTIGIIGYGNIARAVISRLAGWGARIIVSTRTPPPDTEEVRFVDLDTLLSQSDVVLLLSSLNADSRGLLDADRLERLKPGCVLVNTARGGLVDETALVKEIRNGRIAKAALDVFNEEPLPADSPLRGLAGTILTDHVVGHTREMYEAIPRVAAANVRDVMRGIVPSRTRNGAVVSRWEARWAAAGMQNVQPSAERNRS